MKLQAYMQRQIFEPVSVTDATFHLEQRPDLQARRAKYWRRTGGSLEETKQVMPDPIEGDLGGGGLYSTVSELLKIYQGILTGKLLQQTTVEQMFQPQLKTTGGLDSPSEYSLPYRNAVYNAVPNDSTVNYGFGGLLNLTPVPGGRGSCSLTWSGKPNLYWVRSSLLPFLAPSLMYVVAISGSMWAKAWLAYTCLNSSLQEIRLPWNFSLSSRGLYILLLQMEHSFNHA